MNQHSEFNEKGYTVIRNALNIDIVNIITQYALFDEMQDFLPEKYLGLGQTPDAHSKYADPAMESMLLFLQPIIEHATNKNLYPTYSYYRVYRNNDKLDHHTDRESCEISATLSFNFSYYEDKNFRWPIYIDNTPIYLEPGDLAVYKGVDLIHWREPLVYPDDAWHVQAFLHYVDSEGRYSEFKYDKRDTIGMQKFKRKEMSLPKYVEMKK